MRQEFEVAGRLLPPADWTVQVLLDRAPLLAQARLTELVVALFLGAVAAVCVVFVQRRMRLADRFALREQAKANL